MTVMEYKARQQQQTKAKQREISYNPEFQLGDKPKPYGDKFRWVENISDGLRFVGEAYELARREDHPRIVDHQGWYIDNFQSETVHGEVYQLPTRDGKPLYVPAVNDPYNDNAAAVVFADSTHDLLDAIRWSDQLAERWAESEREYQAKSAAEERINEITSEIETLYGDFKAVCREIRANCDKLTGLVQMRKLIRAEYRRVRANVRRLRAEKRKLEANYWEAVPEY